MIKLTFSSVCSNIFVIIFSPIQSFSLRHGTHTFWICCPAPTYAAFTPQMDAAFGFQINCATPNPERIWACVRSDHNSEDGSQWCYSDKTEESGVVVLYCSYMIAVDYMVVMQAGLKIVSFSIKWFSRDEVRRRRDTVCQSLIVWLKAVRYCVLYVYAGVHVFI